MTLNMYAKANRQLFSIILTFCEPNNPSHLWNTYKAYMMEDFLHHSVPFLIAKQATLHQIEKIINLNGKTQADYNLPAIDELISLNLENFNENDHQSIDEANQMKLLLNVNQLNVCNAILAGLNEQPSVKNQHSRLLFMDGPASSGKTFTYNYLVAETLTIRSQEGCKTSTGTPYWKSQEVINAGVHDMEYKKKACVWYSLNV
ncbi:uncharacterized protein LOC136080404 [Hydra vulgaris]|uniref:Uncharacterized protein LOC136080404 n=1 Tax=Hydra vulgaris TaxID=6087 RepID=A0ABM4BV80_HYDVU